MNNKPNTPDVFPMLDNIKLKNSHIHAHFSIYCFSISYKMFLYECPH